MEQKREETHSAHHRPTRRLRRLLHTQTQALLPVQQSTGRAASPPDFFFDTLLNECLDSISNSGTGAKSAWAGVLILGLGQNLFFFSGLYSFTISCNISEKHLIFRAVSGCTALRPVGQRHALRTPGQEKVQNTSLVNKKHLKTWCWSKNKSAAEAVLAKNT